MRRHFLAFWIRVASIRRSAVLGAVALAALAAACASPTESGPPPIDLLGEWAYVAEQDDPAAHLEGTLRIVRQRGRGVEGELVVTETSAGTQFSRSGIVSGRILETTIIDFDVYLDGEGIPRRHVGRLTTDSMAGDWLDMPGAPGMPSAAGVFRAARAVAP
jgi:hypothetical protein